MQMTDAPNNARGALVQQLAQMAQRRQKQSPMAYVDPGAREAAIKAKGGDVSASRDAYANKRLDQFSQIAQTVGGDFAHMFDKTDQQDPAARYRDASALFSKFATQQGVNDPRQLLAQMLQHQHAGDGRSADSAISHGFAQTANDPVNPLEHIASLLGQANTSPSAASEQVGSPGLSGMMGGGGHDAMSLVQAILKAKLAARGAHPSGGSPSAFYGGISNGSPSAFYGG